jgi:hypothetical protein
MSLMSILFAGLIRLDDAQNAPGQRQVFFAGQETKVMETIARNVLNLVLKRRDKSEREPIRRIQSHVLNSNNSRVLRRGFRRRRVRG